MAETPKKHLKSPRNSKHQTKSNPKLSSPSLTPVTPQTQTLAPRRSTRRTSLHFDPAPIEDSEKTPSNVNKTRHISEPKTPRDSGAKSVKKTPKSSRKDGGDSVKVEVSFSPASPEQSESTRKRKRREERKVVTRAKSAASVSLPRRKRRVYYKKVVYDGGEFEIGDDVYVKRREDASSDDEEPEMEECRVCFKARRAVMIECDDCLGGFHLKCLKPPLKAVPEGDWICGFCEARKSGKEVELPVPPEGKKIARTMREKLLSSDLWAAHIER
jgi:origin recognition complex subunit 1